MPPTGIPNPWSERLARQAAERKSLARDRSIRGSQGIDFCSNDYLGLRKDPRLATAAGAAAETYGSGAGAARLLGGTTPLHEALEEALAGWKGSEAGLLFNTGYQCNATLLPALAGAGDGLFSDALNHASLVDGCRMAKARGAFLSVYRHLDLEDLEGRLRQWRAQGGSGLALVATDAVFSMDGDAADLPALLVLCRRHEALLLVDEAHATGLLGPTGAGLAELQGVKGQVPLLMGTLGKALGSFGAYLACPRLLREQLVNTCRGFIFSTALPPPVVGASLAAVAIAREEGWRRTRALAFAARLRGALARPQVSSAIVPLLVGPDAEALRLSGLLQARGLDVRAVRPPTVPEGQARLRFTTGAHLGEADLGALLAALEELGLSRGE